MRVKTPERIRNEICKKEIYCKAQMRGKRRASSACLVMNTLRKIIPIVQVLNTKYIEK